MIIPTYNEVENIRKIISALFDVNKKLVAWNINILVVDDNSPDGTADLVRTMQTEFGKDTLKLVSGNKAGLGKAYLHGFNEVLHTYKSEAIVMMDADFSHNPKSIPILLNAIENGADYVIGSRYVQGGSIPGNWPLMRVVNSRVANFVAHALSGIDKGILDTTGGFKAIRTTTLKKIDLNSINASGYVFQVSLLHAFASRSANIAEVPISFTDRERGTSKMKSRDIIEFIYRVYKLNPQSRIATLIRFGIVGACGSLINLMILTTLVRFTHISILFADLVAIEVSIITNFYMNHFYTFKLREGQFRNYDRANKVFVKLLKFNAGAIGGALISFTAFYVFHQLLHVNYVVADLYAILLATGWNYWVSTKIVWKIVDART
ncbi:MAG: glycosyltransferase family 2 protein [Methylophilaceae bacterium]|nr:glycosyltransferase family 2 protein [Methylophilaceae bacterium]